MTTPSTTEEVHCHHQIHVDHSTYCLSRVGRNVLPDIDAVTIPSHDGEPTKYRLVFPLTASADGYLEETSRGRLMLLLNGMCIGAVMGRNALAAERSKENYRPDVFVFQCPRCGSGRFIAKSDKFGTELVGVDPFEVCCDECGLSAVFELDREHGSLFAKLADDASVRREVFKDPDAMEPLPKPSPVRQRYLSIYEKCCDCGRTAAFTVDGDTSFRRGQYPFGCACGASATAYFDRHGALQVAWESPKRPKCPVPEGLFGLISSLYETERSSRAGIDTVLSQRFETVRDLGAHYYKHVRDSVVQWQSAAAEWDRENTPDF